MFTMAVVIAMLRGVNVGGYQKLNMEALRTLCGGLGLRDVQTYIQSGNVVFREDSGDPGLAARKIEDGIERKFGFRPDVIVRTTSELRKVIAGNPFAKRPEVEPNRLLVLFMASTPGRQAREHRKCRTKEYNPRAGSYRSRSPVVDKFRQRSTAGRHIGPLWY